MVWIGHSSPCGWSSPWLMVSHGMVCLGPQWSANICKVYWGHMELQSRGHSALKITRIFFFKWLLWRWPIFQHWEVPNLLLVEDGSQVEETQSTIRNYHWSVIMYPTQDMITFNLNRVCSLYPKLISKGQFGLKKVPISKDFSFDNIINFQILRIYL